MLSVDSMLRIIIIIIIRILCYCFFVCTIIDLIPLRLFFWGGGAEDNKSVGGHAGNVFKSCTLRNVVTLRIRIHSFLRFCM